MCGIAAIVSLDDGRVPALGGRLRAMSDLIAHRGPDGAGAWMHPHEHVGMAHRRLEIIDLDTGSQPMSDGFGNWVTYNGEIYNYLELREELGEQDFRTRSDTEVILLGYRRWGLDVVHHLRGMFAFALWDEHDGLLFCARDRLGIKPVTFSQVGGLLYIASEAKALLPFLSTIATDRDGLRDYLAFQACLDGKTLFASVRELPAGHLMTVRRGSIRIERYWNLYYDLDFDHTGQYFEREVRERIEDSVRVHLRSDVPVGTYLSGGLDSSIIATLAAQSPSADLPAFHGRFGLGRDYDESHHAQAVADQNGLNLEITDIASADFVRELPNVIYHLDYPVAGPGSFPQYMVSRDAARTRKVVLGGQGGDELFGGYVRYLVAYLEQVLKAAIDGTMYSGKFIVDYQTILPNLEALRGYRPMLQEFWRDGLFEDMDRRYFRLINRSNELGDVVRWDGLGDYSPFESFRKIFLADNASNGSYFDRMTHFDFKALLPALLHVEDRVSMAHGLESRLPFLDHALVELAASIPSDVKFEGGKPKRLLRAAFGDRLPRAVVDRSDKMGFPTPAVEWSRGDAHDFVFDTLTSQAAAARPYIDNRKALQLLDQEPRFGRGFWGVLSLELWQQRFHDRASEFRFGGSDTMTG
jgi:asparagine synthase (glutamine-hydrolysing)